MSEKVPFVAFSNEELESQPKVESGETICCPRCGEQHRLLDGDPPGLLLFYHCGEDLCLGAVDGRLVVGKRGSSDQGDE